MTSLLMMACRSASIFELPRGASRDEASELVSSPLEHQFTTAVDEEVVHCVGCHDPASSCYVYLLFDDEGLRKVVEPPTFTYASPEDYIARRREVEASPGDPDHSISAILRAPASNAARLAEQHERHSRRFRNCWPAFALTAPLGVPMAMVAEVLTPPEPEGPDPYAVVPGMAVEEVECAFGSPDGVHVIDDAEEIRIYDERVAVRFEHGAAATVYSNYLLRLAQKYLDERFRADGGT